MSAFDELKQRYMLSRSTSGGGTSGVPSGSGEAGVTSHGGCRITPLIHGTNYYPALKTAINAVSGSSAFVYLAGWWFGESFSLDAASGGSALTNLLKIKASQGVDVRVLGWIFAPQVLNSRVLRAAIASGRAPASLLGYLGINDHTMLFVERLRAEPQLANKAVLNLLAHPAGAAHLKFALVGTNEQATGFTGGIDMEGSRWSTSWHDGQAQIQGPVLQDFFQTFQQMWNEVRSRSPQRVTAVAQTLDTHSTSMPDLPTRTIAGGGGTVHAQSLRTLPRFNFMTGASMTPVPTNSPLSYAPNGLFEVKAAWEKAIKAAQRYVYIEDQSFWSHEVMSWLNEAVRRNSDLRIILLIGTSDPTEPPDPTRLRYFADAVNRSLLAGLTASSPEISRIGVFTHRNLFIHTKSTIIDDNWGLIGSANAMRRSLYTDFEHSVAFMDENNTAVAAYREQLWGVHFRSSVVDLAAAVARWFAIPFRGTPAVPGAIPIDRLPLPLPAVTLSASETAQLDSILDTDSRQAWGSGLLDAVPGGGITVSGG